MQGRMHRVNGPEQAIKKSHHTQPNCRGRRNLDSRRNKRENGAETQNKGTESFEESTVGALPINGPGKTG